MATIPDLTTLQNVKAYGNLVGTGDDALLTRLITGYSDVAENNCNNNLRQQTYTNQVMNGLVDQYGLITCWLKVPVIQELTAASWRSPEQPLSGYSSLDVTQVDMDQRQSGCVVKFLNPSIMRLRGQRVRVQMSYTGGYSGVDQGSYPVPADLEAAVMRLVWWAYKKREAPTEKTAIPEMGVVIVPSAWPSDVLRVLNNYKTVTP